MENHDEYQDVFILEITLFSPILSLHYIPFHHFPNF